MRPSLKSQQRSYLVQGFAWKARGKLGLSLMVESGLFHFAATTRLDLSWSNRAVVISFDFASRRWSASIILFCTILIWKIWSSREILKNLKLSRTFESTESNPWIDYVLLVLSGKQHELKVLCWWTLRSLRRWGDTTSCVCIGCTWLCKCN